MTADEPRIPPLSPAAFTHEQAALVGAWENLNLSRVLVRRPDLYRAFIPLIDTVIRGSTLPAHDREVLVFRALALCGETYETHHHGLIARKTGMDDEMIEAARTAGPTLPPADRVLVAAAEELVRDHRVSDETWGRLGERYTQAQRMEVVFLVGAYTALAMATRSFDVEVEADPAAFERLAELREYT